jgi:hypothetical protein
VKGGEFDDGIKTIRAGLSLALEHELTLGAAEVYRRLGTAHEIAGDYGGARDALATAVGFCEANGADGMEHTCLSCMAYVLRELGDWGRAVELSEELRFPGASADTTLVADGVLGSIRAFRGEWPAAGRCSSGDALAALAHALGETALAEGHRDAAAHQLCRAAERHASLEIPFERAQVQLRAGVALAAVGQREAAAERFVEVHVTARRLGASPLAAQAAGAVAKLGESVEQRLGRRAAADHAHGGHARAQHPHEAPLPVAHRGRDQGRQPRPAGVARESSPSARCTVTVHGADPRHRGAASPRPARAGRR